MSIAFKIKGAWETGKTLAAIAKQLGDFKTDDIATEVRDVARDNLASTYQGYQTGQMWRNIRVARGQTGRNSATVTATRISEDTGADIVPIHEFGGVIYPKNKPFLAVGKRTGETVHFAHNVVIPAKAFMTAAFEWVAGEIRNYTQKKVRLIVESKGRSSGWGA